MSVILTNMWSKKCVYVHVSVDPCTRPTPVPGTSAPAHNSHGSLPQRTPAATYSTWRSPADSGGASCGSRGRGEAPGPELPPNHSSCGLLFKAMCQNNACVAVGNEVAETPNPVKEPLIRGGGTKIHNFKCKTRTLKRPIG